MFDLMTEEQHRMICYGLWYGASTSTIFKSLYRMVDKRGRALSPNTIKIKRSLGWHDTTNTKWQGTVTGRFKSEVANEATTPSTGS
jgi:hypothetical protein